MSSCLDYGAAKALLSSDCFKVPAGITAARVRFCAYSRQILRLLRASPPLGLLRLSPALTALAPLALLALLSRSTPLSLVHTFEKSYMHTVSYQEK